MRQTKGLFTALLLSLALISGGCGNLNSTPSGHFTSSTDIDNKDTIQVTDSIGRNVTISTNLSRAVICNAYNAELITAIGAIDKVCGVDYYIYQDQEGFKHRFSKDMLVGNTRGGLNLERIIQLNPQVIILCENDDWENVEKKLRPFGIPVVVCNAYYTSEFTENTKLLGQIFNKRKEAEELVNFFSSHINYINDQLKGVPKKTIYFEYRLPGRTTIPDDYFYDMVKFAHADNIFTNAKSVQIQLEDVVKKNPEYIVKVSEPNVYSSYIPPTKEDMSRIYNSIVSRPGWDSIDAVKNDHILLLSHYVHGGASKLIGTMYIAKFMYPDKLTELYPEEIFKTWVVKYQGLKYYPGHTYPAFPLKN